ncbi:ribonuclease H-like domain-containing protein [Tanacetum coccineum]
MGDQTADEYFSKIEAILTLLTDLGLNMSDDDVVTYAINGLSDKYGSLAQIIAHKDPFPDLATVRSMVATEELRLRSRSSVLPTVPQHVSNNSTTHRTTQGTLHMHAGYQSGGLNVSQQQQLLHLLQAQQTMLAQFGFNGLSGQSRPTAPPGFQSGSTPANGQATLLPQAFNTMTLRDPTYANWNMDTSASSHLNSNATNLSTLFNSCMYLSILVGDGKSIPVTNTGHSTLPTPYRPLHLNNLGKHVRLPFSLSETIVKSPFEIIHLDLWTSPLSSISGIKYYVLFLDHFSHYLWVYPLRNKSDALSKFIHFRAFVKNQFQCDIKSLQCDHGALCHWLRMAALSLHTGIDVDETFSPVVKPATIHTVLSLALSRHWPVHQLDVKNAFLHGSLSETIYMHHPLFSGFTTSDHVCLLQAISIWDLSKPLRAAGPIYLLALYVDDIILTASSTAFLQRMFLSQQKYASELLERAGMLTCNPCRTPVDTDSKLSADGDPVSDPTLYRSLAGALQYLTFTRPDISYAVQQVCLYMHDPREPHFSALKRILRYIRGTMPYGLQLFSSTTSSLVAYSDADWAGCPTTRRSTSSYCVFLGNNLLLWSSKRQVTLSRSSAEAEYRGVANAVAETCWLRNLLRELHTPLSTATLVYCDNVSAVYLSSNPVQHQRTKHIEIDIHFVRDLVAAGHIRVLHVPSRYQYADVFTKGLPTVLFDEFRSSLSVRSSPANVTST